jgi:hypothetical protein
LALLVYVLLCCLLFCITHKWYDCVGQCLLFALFTNIGTRDVREKFLASVFNQFWIKEKLNWTVRLLFPHSGCLKKFQQNIQKLMLIEKSICWVFLIEVFEISSRSSLMGTCVPIFLYKHWYCTGCYICFENPILLKFVDKHIK